MFKIGKDPWTPSENVSYGYPMTLAIEHVVSPDLWFDGQGSGSDRVVGHHDPGGHSMQ